MIKSSTVLQQVRQRLLKGARHDWAGKHSPFICTNLREIAQECEDRGDHFRELCTAISQLIYDIQSRLSPCLTLESWLMFQHDVPMSEVILRNGIVDGEIAPTMKMAKHRLAWLDQLIQEHELKGD